MRGGAKQALCVTLTLAVGACASEGNELKIRAIADPGAAARNATDRIGHARGQLALGNVGLAIEGFRTALREQPDSVEAYAGLAACYEAMGRYDVARTNYEAALALAPDNAALLNSFAIMLDHQGLRQQAAAVRAEVAQRLSAAAALAAEAERPEPVEAARSVTVVLPPAQPTAKAPMPVEVGRSVTVVLPPPRPAPKAPAQPAVPRVAVAEAVLPKPNRAAPLVAVAAPPLASPLGTDRIAVGEIEALQPVEPAPSLTHPREAELRVTVENRSLTSDQGWKRLAVGPLAFAEPEPAKPLPREAAAVLTKPGAAPAEVAVAGAFLKPGTRLERLSLGEVALVTSDGPIWRPQLVGQSQRSATVRFVPLRQANARPAIRILNAARHQGLAARTRSVLVERGWRRLDIGDAPRVRSSSLVLYPASRRVLGRRLAAQFGFRSLVHDGSDVVVLLGRDAAAVRFTRTGG